MATTFDKLLDFAQCDWDQWEKDWDEIWAEVMAGREDN